MYIESLIIKTTCWGQGCQPTGYIGVMITKALAVGGPQGVCHFSPRSCLTCTLLSLLLPPQLQHVLLQCQPPFVLQATARIYCCCCSCCCCFCSPFLLLVAGTCADGGDFSCHWLMVAVVAVALLHTWGPVCYHPSSFPGDLESLFWSAVGRVHLI